MEHYIYRGEPVERVFGPLEAGDYNFIVADYTRPYFKNDKWILSVKLIIEPSKAYVFANPWTGTTAAGEERDGIADFLCSCNRAPKPGTEPHWETLIGARGRCRLKVEIAQQGSMAGKEVNKVHYFYRPKELEQPQTYTEDEVQKAAQAARRTNAVDDDPDDIPF